MKNIQIEKEYGALISEILCQYSLPVKVEFVTDAFEWLKANNCLIRKNQSCYTLATTIKMSEGAYIILMNKEVSDSDLKAIMSRVNEFHLLKETRDFITHLVLHEICHVLISLNRKDSIIDDLCDTWAFNEMGLLKRNNRTLPKEV